MSTPQVTEIERRPEPVAHDTFIDDLCVDAHDQRATSQQRARPEPGAPAHAR